MPRTTWCATSSMIARWCSNSFSVATSGTITSGCASTHRRLEDGARLHLGDLGVGDAEAAAAVAEHRVGLAQRLDDAVELVAGDLQLTREELALLAAVGEELV